MSDPCPSHPCRIIGVLDDGPAGLTRAALAHLRAADLVIGGTRLLNLCAGHLAPQAERRDLTGCLESVPTWISKALAAGRRVVVLATGDPLFHGIAGYLRARLPGLPFEILPNLSTVQVACARLGLAWRISASSPSTAGTAVSGMRARDPNTGFTPSCAPSSTRKPVLARAPPVPT